MSRILAILLSSVAMLVVFTSTAALTVEIISVLVRPVAFSLHLGEQTITVLGFHWTIFAIAGCVGIVALFTLWHFVFPDK